MPKRRPSSAVHSRDRGDSSSISKRKRVTNQTESSVSSAGSTDLTKNGCQNSITFTFTHPAETFAQLIHPMTEEVFFSQYWEKEPLLLDNRSSYTEFFESLFSRAILERVTAERKVSFLRDCNVCRYKGGKRESLNGRGVMRPQQLKDLFDKAKGTVQFHQPQRFQVIMNLNNDQIY